jgi:quinol monooxygenase YgiN
MKRGQVIYEVTLHPEPSIQAAFDAWLAGHVQEMLALPGFLEASVYRTEDPGSGDVLRTVHYVLRDREALEAYLREHADRMRSRGIERFGEKFSASRKILESGGDVTTGQSPGERCANCESPLYGQYCASCGQRARDRMISLWEMIREASEILTSLESRLWRTLGLLLVRPGRLTRDYLLGRRARYIPALRLFLGLSLLFFFLFSLDSRLSVEAGDEDAGDISLRLQIGDEETPSNTGEETPAAGSAETTDDGQEPEALGNEEQDRCTDVQVAWPEGMGWANRWLSSERLQAACRKIVDDHGASFVRALLENIPAMMFIFVPLMAAVMKLLYPLSGRYYAEHLLFLVHFHAFFYLLLSIDQLAGWIFDGEWLPHWPASLLYAFSAVYIPVYLFRAMRVVYEQGRLMTGFKYSLLGVAYLTSLLLFLASTMTITAVTL